MSFGSSTRVALNIRAKYTIRTYSFRIIDTTKVFDIFYLGSPEWEIIIEPVSTI